MHIQHRIQPKSHFVALFGSKCCYFVILCINYANEEASNFDQSTWKNACMISKAYSAHKTVQIASCEPFWPKYNIFDKLCINYANEEASNFDQSTWKNVCMISKAYLAQKTIQIESCDPFWPKYYIFDMLRIHYAN